VAFAEPGTPTRIANTSLVTTHDVPAPPAGSGGLLVQAVAINANPTITPPSGYTPLLDVPNPFNTTKLFVCYRFAVGGEGATTFDTDVTTRSVGSFWRVTLAHDSTPPEAATATGGSLTPVHAALDPSGWGTEDTLWLALLAWINATTNVQSQPTNYTGFAQDETSASGTTSSGFASACRKCPRKYGLPG
jgi:hypothetical protein